jgi:hypothetical protein
MGVSEMGVKEVWFAGHLSGKPYNIWTSWSNDRRQMLPEGPPDTAKHALTNISLQWTVEEVMESDCNIQFDFDAFDKRHIPRSIGNGAPTSDQDQLGAIQGTNDDLWRSPPCWLLEFVPLSYVYQDEKGKWVSSWWWVL